MTISVSTMDKKIYAVIAVVIIVIAAVGAYLVINKDSDDESGSTISAIARVNTDGSGIYLKAEYDPADFYTENADGSIELIPSAWGGKVWGTPGTSSIQHVQMMQMAEEMGLGWAKYNGGSLDSNTMYYVDSISNYDAAVEKNSEILDGGILWEPQYTMIASNPIYQEFLLTNDLFPGHTCCVIAGSTSYMESNPEVTVAFLAAYKQAVDYVNAALQDKESEEYATLIDICIKYTTGLTEEQIGAALDNIVYKFSDDNVTGSLDDLVDDIADLETNLYDMGSITTDIADLGFSNSTEFAEALVDDSYLTQAVAGEATDVGNVTVTVAAITGDVHQIGIRIAQDLGFFEQYGITVNVTSLANGGAVALDILNGHSDFALLGAPPLTSNVVNGHYIHA